MKQNYLLTKSYFGKKFILLVAFLLTYLSMVAQSVTYQNGIAQGVVKVEFEQSMTPTLSRMQITTKGNSLSTGIVAFDKAVNSLDAVNMERLFPEVPNAALEAKHRRAGLHLWYVIRFDENVSPQKALQTLKSVKGIKQVGLEYEKVLAPMEVTPYTPSAAVKTAQIFNDPMLKDQWHYINTGQLGLDGPRADVNLKEAWGITAGKSDIIISVHDQGIDVNHEDLRDNMWVNPGEIAGNGEDDDGNGYIDDVHGFNFVDLVGKISAMPHGTHVGGTIAAVNNNGIGVSGVAGGTGKGDGVKLMSLQILDGGQSTNIARSYIYAADMGAVISQNSWGYSVPGVYEADVLVGIDYFIDNAGDYQDSPMKGGIVIFASGNDFRDDFYYPGYYERTFTVSSVGPEYQIASYSNYGDWIEVSAPGGDQNTYVMAKAGVLSTLPNNQYGYMQGTSMACPHVSGIAGLVLANRTKQMTNTELWNILLTSTNDVDIYNPNYVGKLGTGSIDAALALKSNTGVAPEAITTLEVTGMAQEFATLKWVVPNDDIDGAAHQFYVYYSEEEITSENLEQASFKFFNNKAAIGEEVTFEINDLKGKTKYYFAVTSVDRWTNYSDLSNIVSGTTNDGPAIDVDTGNAEKLFSISTSMPEAIASESFKLLNTDEGVLRWSTYIRNTGYQASTTAYSLPFAKSNLIPQGLESAPATVYDVVRNQEPASGQGMNFELNDWRYVPYSRLYIGDSDSRLPVSGALKFNVTDKAGFNLTQIGVNLRYQMGTGPVLVEVYEGDLKKENLRRTEILEPTSSWTTAYTVPLKEHVYFEQNTSFYIVVHVPGGNGYSLAVGELESPAHQGLSWYSSDLGNTWQTFVGAGIPDFYAWNIVASSASENIINLVELTPSTGVLEGNSEALIDVKTNVSTLINGTYKANVVFESNDHKNPEYRMPLEVNVTGQKPNIVHPKVVEYGSVFQEESKILDVLIENYGYGLIENLTAAVDNPQFEVLYTPSQILARSSSAVRVKFKPTVGGNISGLLKLTNGVNTYSISLFGVGTETSEIAINPVVNNFADLTIGEAITSEFTITNTGKYPLMYFVPGYDTQNISSEWKDYHKSGYVVRSNDANVSKIDLEYNFNDITSIGVDITGVYVDQNWASIDLPFAFPFYGKEEKTIHITNKGFTTFDNTYLPSNVPELGNGLGSYISPVGFGVSLGKDSKVHYRAESDHFIIQYTNLENRSGQGAITAQMVLHINGDIRFYYKDIPTTGINRDLVVVLIEDRDRSDGILIRDQDSDFYLQSNTAIGFDYPGPDIITSIENSSGVLAPNQKAIVKVALATDSLTEGVTKRNVNIISNDPLNPIVSHTAVLEITNGGEVDYEFSTELLDLGLLYVNNEYGKEFSIKNTGSKKLGITSIEFDSNVLSLPIIDMIDPGINQLLKLVPNTEAVGDISEVIKFNFSDGTSKEISVVGQVRNAPDIDLDLALVSADLKMGEFSKTPFQIENTGGSELEVSVIGGPWFNFFETSTSVKKSFDYHVKKENSGEPSYNWLDITETGKKLPTDDNLTGEKELYWKEIQLPFPFTFYGKEYNSFKVGDNGLLAFGGDPDSFVDELTQDIPIKQRESAYIFAMFGMSYFDSYNYPEKAGLYVQEFEDKVVISWMHSSNLFSWGQSGQVILFKDNTIKIMYNIDPMTLNGTETITVGLQDIGGEDYKVISSRTNIDPGKGIAYVILPEDVVSIDVGEKIEGEIVLDSSNIYGGDFEDSFLIKTNVPSKTELEKPVSIKVEGTQEVEVASEFDLGEVEVFFDEYFGDYNSSVDRIQMHNTGNTPVRLTYALMEKADQYLSMLIGVPGPLGIEYIPITYISEESFQEILILPGASYELVMSFAPEKEGTYEDTVILKTSAGDLKVKLTGFAYDPVALNVDKSLIEAVFKNFDESSKHSIKFDNAEGGYKLDYSVHIDYLRNGVEARPFEKVAKNASSKADVSSIQKVEHSKALSTKSSTEENRVLKYFDESMINNAIGNQGFTSTNIATRYIAPEDGFNLSGIANIFQVDGEESGTYTVEIRVGGDDITTASTFATKEVAYENLDIVANSYKTIIELDEAIQVLPNEAFYVIVSYPYNLTYPQLLQLGGVEEVHGRYLWYSADDGWVDFQAYVASIDSASGFASYVIENEFKESGWIKLLSDNSGTLGVGEESQMDIEIVANFGDRGNQQANVVFESSDLNASVVKVPVSLYINQGPQFIDAASSVILSETETITMEIEIADLEEHTFVVELTDVPEFVTYTKTESNGIELIISPEYGDEGNYSIKLTAVDEYDATTEHTLDIHVAKTNRAPEFIGNLLEFRLSLETGLEKFDIHDHFIDPDGDTFTFVLKSENADIVNAYQSGSDTFVLEPNSEGEADLVFVLEDEYGAVSNITIQGIVTTSQIGGACLSPENILVQMWNSTFVVNNPGNKYVAYQWFKNGIKVEGATKQYYSETGSKELDIYAEYYVVLTKEDGSVDITCPIRPIRYEAKLSAYPNPIKSGASITVVTELPDLGVNPANIQVVNMNGQVLQSLSTNKSENTINMPYGSGVYIIKVSNKSITKSFKILVN